MYPPRFFFRFCRIRQALLNKARSVIHNAEKALKQLAKFEEGKNSTSCLWESIPAFCCPFSENIENLLSPETFFAIMCEPASSQNTLYLAVINQLFQDSFQILRCFILYKKKQRGDAKIFCFFYQIIAYSLRKNGSYLLFIQFFLYFEVEAQENFLFIENFFHKNKDPTDL